MLKYKNELLKKQLLKTVLKKEELQKHNLKLIFYNNVCLVSITFILVYFQLYRLSLMSFIFLLINNNQQLKEIINNYSKEKQKFTKYYKKNFPIFYYGLPPVGILSGLGVLYTGCLLSNLSQKIFFEEVSFFVHQQELQSLQWLFTVFTIIFIFYIIIDTGIAIYIIFTANPPIGPCWQVAMSAAQFVRGTFLIGGTTVTGGTIVGGLPEPTIASNYVHTKTSFGRGWDVAPEEIYVKKDFMKLQHVVGRDFLLEKLNELNTGENKKIVSRETYQKMLENQEVRNKVLNAKNISKEELSLMGFITLPEVANSTVKQAVKTGLDYMGDGLEYIGDTAKSYFGRLKIFIWGDSFVQDDSAPDISEEEFQRKQADTTDKSVGKKAIKD